MLGESRNIRCKPYFFDFLDYLLGVAIHLPQCWSIARRQGCQQVHAVGLDYILESKDVNFADRLTRATFCVPLFRRAKEEY